MWRAVRPCAEPNCVKLPPMGKRYCEQHASDNSRMQAERFRKTEDDIWKMYNGSRWERFRQAILGQNPICQRLVDGQQCRHVARVVHHVISPRVRPDLFVEPQNVKCVCFFHHSPNEGEPDPSPEALAKIYTPTVWRFPNI
jgi:hypothetical protein